MVSNFMASEDLNVCVDALMTKKTKAQFMHEKEQVENLVNKGQMSKSD